MYDDILTMAGAHPGLFDRGLERLDESAIAALVAAHPNLPRSYLDFLGTVGCGSFGGSRFMLYEAPLTPEEAYVKADGLADMLLFADDFAGRFSAFRPGSDAIFEFDMSAPNKVSEAAPDFATFIRGKLAALAKGKS